MKDWLLPRCMPSFISAGGALASIGCVESLSGYEEIYAIGVERHFAADMFLCSLIEGSLSPLLFNDFSAVNWGFQSARVIATT